MKLKLTVYISHNKKSVVFNSQFISGLHLVNSLILSVPTCIGVIECDWNILTQTLVCNVFLIKKLFAKIELILIMW